MDIQTLFASVVPPTIRGCLAGVLSNAFVFLELEAEARLRVGNSLQGFHGNLEVAITKCADSNSRSRANPLDDPEIALGHD